MAAPFELSFKVLTEGFDALKTLSQGIADATAETRSLAAANQEAASAESTEADELARLTELLGSEANARASLASRIIDTTATQVASEEEVAASLERRAAILAAVEETEAARIATQQEAAASATASAAEEVAAAEQVAAVQAGEISLATQATLAKQAAGEAARNLAAQLQDLSQAQKNLAEIEAAEPGNVALVTRTQQELAAETQRVAEAEQRATQAKQAATAANERLATSEKAAAEAARAATFAGKTQELGQLFTTLGLVDPALLRVGVGMQMLGTAAESLGPQMAAAGGGVAAFATVLGPMVLIAGAVVAALAVVGEGVHLLHESLTDGAKELAEEDTLARYLGSLDQAKQRLEAINQLSIKSIPIPVDQLVQATEKLTLFSHGALGTAEDLKMVADAAIATQKPVATVAQAVGGLEASLASGAGPGRYATQLQRLAVLTPGVVTELKNMQKAGSDGAAMWEVAREAIMRWSGESENAARTFGGSVTLLSNQWQVLLRAFGTPIVDALTPLVREIGTLLPQLVPKAQAAGKAIGDAIKTIYGLVKDGELADELADKISLGAAKGVRDLIRQFTDAWNQIKELFSHPLKVTAEIDQHLYGGVADWLKNKTGFSMQQELERSDGSSPPEKPPTDDSLTGLLEAHIRDLEARMAQREQKARNNTDADAPRYDKPVTGTGDGDDTAPTPKASRGGAGHADNSALKERQAELQALQAAEKEYQDTLKLTDAQLALGEISPAQAEQQNIQTVQEYITKLEALRDKLRNLQDQGPKTQEAIAQVTLKLKQMQLEEMKQTPFGQLQLKLIQLRNQFADLGKSFADLAANQINGAIDGIAQSLGQLAVGTNNIKQAFLSYVESTVSGLVKIMGQQAAAAALSSLLKSKDTAETISNNAQKSASSASTGLLESIASWGIAAAVGAAAFLAAMAITGGFQSGGYTGHGRPDEVAGVVHRGEYVLNAAAVNAWGIDALHAMSQMRVPAPALRTAGAYASAARSNSGGGYSPTGRASGPRTSRGGSQPAIHVNSFPDADAMNRHIANNPDAHHILVNKFTASAVSLGLPTS